MIEVTIKIPKTIMMITSCFFRTFSGCLYMDKSIPQLGQKWAWFSMNSLQRGQFMLVLYGLTVEVDIGIIKQIDIG